MDSTIGAVEIGTVLSGVLFGLITSQTYVYFKTFPRDSRLTKALLAHTVCIFNALYLFTVTGYGDPSTLVRFPVSLDVTIIFHGATVIIVQIFFTHRITKFMQKAYYLGVTAIALLFLRFAAFIVTGVVAIKMTDLRSFMGAWKALILFDLLSCAITDVVMSGVLVYQLATRRSDFVFPSTLAMMDKLIMWSVETCLVTTFTTLTILVCFLTMENKNFIWIGIFLVQPKIFSNAMLANLNSRTDFHAGLTDVHELTPSRPVRFTPPSSGTVLVSKESATFSDAGSTFQAGASPVESKFQEGRQAHAIMFSPA
ncbi:hypothetical protein C8R46DRAFT_1081862 [Mycena filopes]|nr:hypothetical protein C8R46DRAFT_1081862 [Mycena filopes]